MDGTGHGKKTVPVPNNDPAIEGGIGDLFRDHGPDLVKFIRSKVGNGPPDAEDIAQQAFANVAALRLKQHKPIENPPAFLFRTASNLIKDYFRSAAVRTSLQIGDGQIDDYLTERNDLTPEVIILANERFSCVRAVIEQLPRRQRRFLILNRIQGLSYREIARQSGVGVGTVGRDLEIAVGQCRAALKAFDENNHDE